MSDIDLSGRHILIVDDEPFVRNLIVRMLKEMGEPSIETAQNGEEAMNILAQTSNALDIALFDFNMPKKNGLELLKAVRCGKMFIRRDLPVAMLTGNSDSALVRTALALDVNAFLVKPTSRAALGARLKRVLSEEPHVQDVEIYRAVELTDWHTEEHPQPDHTASIMLPPRSANEHAPAATGTLSRLVTEPDRQLPKVRRRIDDVPPDAILAADVLNQHGVCLLRAGARLTPRFLNRLHDIAEMERIDFIWIRQAAVA